MAIYNYTAKDYHGQYHKGEIEAVDLRTAAQVLLKKRLIVISLKSREENTRKFLQSLFNRVSFSDLVMFTRQLATMIGAGLVISEALDSLSSQQTNKGFKDVLEKVSADINGGLDFGSALQKHPHIFPSLYINLIKAGEASGKLDIMLQKLATHMEKEREFRGKVKGAMIYPIVVVAMMFGVMLIMVFFVMPKLMTLYSESNIELPLPTKIMLSVSGFIINFWWVVLILVVALILVVKRWLQTPKGRNIFDEGLLKIPVMGRIITMVVLSNFSSTMSLLVTAGIPMLDSIKIVEEIVGNSAFKTALDKSYKGVERGLSFSDQLSSQIVFPKLVSQMVKTGEATGKLDEVLAKMAEYFETESENSLKNITTLIEPLVLIVLGIGVALLVISIILPIYKLTTSVS